MENGNIVAVKGLFPSGTPAAGWDSMVRGRCAELSPTDGFPPIVPNLTTRWRGEEREW